ncbi:hypothetical protein HAX54_004957 [Datura stramonium]|uniref:Histidine-containing phosphotransfer protein n=1 Tax=Datura stramonium TaxID=4076 RepID=A0ABS8WWV6_DATST|nr:hypothetical protein [Datura stramonium]
MENVGKLQIDYITFMSSLYRELQKLQDESNPDFVVEVASFFFDDQQVVNFKQVDAHVHQFKGSSSSIGAQRVKNVLIAFRNFCEEKNLDGCMQYLQHAKHEYFLVKNKLETLFRLEQQILDGGGTIPVIS